MFKTLIQNMNSFETWQVITQIIQTAILLMTFMAAFYIGLKQNEINQNLLGLQKSPSLGVNYDIQKHALIFMNFGQHNISLYGFALGERKRIDKEPQTITPNAGFQWVLEEDDWRFVETQTTNRITVYIKNSLGGKFITNNLMSPVFKDGKLVGVSMQNLSTIESYW